MDHGYPCPLLSLLRLHCLTFSLVEYGSFNCKYITPSERAHLTTIFKTYLTLRPNEAISDARVVLENFAELMDASASGGKKVEEVNTSEHYHIYWGVVSNLHDFPFSKENWFLNSMIGPKATVAFMSRIISSSSIASVHSLSLEC